MGSRVYLSAGGMQQLTNLLVGNKAGHAPDTLEDFAGAAANMLHKTRVDDTVGRWAAMLHVGGCAQDTFVAQS